MMKPYTLLSAISFFLIPTISQSQTFTRITSGVVTNTPADSRSVNWVDVNNDNLIDLMITNGPQGGQNNFLYINNGGGNFTAVTNDAIVVDNAPSDGATWADADNDGDLDCFVVNWYNQNNLMYMNNGNGSFTQITTGSPVTDLGFSETASWGDYDKDGLVDLYVTNSAGQLKNFLYHNDAWLTFTKITTGTMVNDQFASRSVNWTDIDLDGDPDLFITNENGQSENIYRNDSAGVFTKLTGGVLLTNVGNTMSGSWGDYDNDGDLDVFLANEGSNNALFRNDGNFVFVKITGDTVSKTGGDSFSSAWGDIDNDGDLDLFVTNSFGTGLHLNYLFTNDGNGNFTRVNNTAPATDTDWSYGCAFGDYDNDGFEDLAVATCRYNSVDRSDILYHNDGNSNHWITMKMKGSISNRSAIGTKVRIKAVINGNVVWQYREVSAQSSYCGQNDLRVHFGLGNATIVDSVKVEWPSGIVEYFIGVNANQFINITELQGITGINETQPDQELYIYPNPSAEGIRINVPFMLQKGDRVTASNISGETLTYLVIDERTTSIHLTRSQLQNIKGVVFISIRSGEKVMNGKVVMQ